MGVLCTSEFVPGVCCHMGMGMGVDMGTACGECIWVFRNLLC